ncbi:hypothetical protein AB0G05_42635 [Nonomuraea wenchangensis]
MPTTPEADEILAERYPTDGAGRTLVAIRDAALPIAALSVTALVQERKRIPLLDEFVLRLAQMEVNTSEDISGVLGLDEQVVSRAIAGQLSENTLRYVRSGSSRTVQLTPKGQQTATELTSIRPSRRNVECFFDRLAWELHPCDERDLLFAYELEEQGLIELPPDRGKAISESDLSPSALNAFLAQVADPAAEESIEVVNVRKFSAKRTRRFRPVKLLVYADATRQDINLAVVVDDEVSRRHELALAALGGASALGIRVDEPAERPMLADELERLRVPTGGTAPEAPALETTDPGQQPEDGAQAAAPEVRALTVFEHRTQLDLALTTAAERLLIISPWLRPEVINTDFIAKLEGRLRRRVRVHIAHGYQDDVPHPGALRRLENLAKRFPNLFTFTRIKNTHAKILIFDDTWISTSFNWLSFRGDPNRTYRMEEGTLVRDRAIADAQYERLVQRVLDEAVT